MTRARNNAGVNLTNKVDYALPVDTETGTTYTFTLANATQLVAATNASAKTFTVPPQASVAWEADTVIRVVNYGAGALTINGGAGVTVTNTATTVAQYASAAVIRTGSNAWTLVPFSGGGSKATVSATTGSPTTGSVTVDGTLMTYYDWTGSGSITFSNSQAALVKMLVVGGGGASGGTDGSGYSCGGGGGGAYEGYVRVSSGAYTVIVAGSAGRSYVSAGTEAQSIGQGGAGTAGGGGRPCGTGYSGEGFPGGNGTNSGGGGGSRGVGGDGSGGAGGAGLTSSINGTSTVYGQGGGGSNNTMTGVATGGGGSQGGAGGLPSNAGRGGRVVIAVPI